MCKKSYPGKHRSCSLLKWNWLRPYRSKRFSIIGDREKRMNVAEGTVLMKREDMQMTRSGGNEWKKDDRFWIRSCRRKENDRGAIPKPLLSGRSPMGEESSWLEKFYLLGIDQIHTNRTTNRAFEYQVAHSKKLTFVIYRCIWRTISKRGSLTIWTAVVKGLLPLAEKEGKDANGYSENAIKSMVSLSGFTVLVPFQTKAMRLRVNKIEGSEYR